MSDGWFMPCCCDFVDSSGLRNKGTPDGCWLDKKRPLFSIENQANSLSFFLVRRRDESAWIRGMADHMIQYIKGTAGTKMTQGDKGTRQMTVGRSIGPYPLLEAGPSRAKRWKPPGKIRVLGGGGFAAGGLCQGGHRKQGGPQMIKYPLHALSIFLHTAPPPPLLRGMANMASMACMEDPSRPLDVRLLKSCRAV